MTTALFEHDHTLGDLYAAVFRIDNEQDARTFFDDYVAWMERRPDLTAPPADVVRSNIGWIFGEGMAPERIAMWAKVCGASHPVFGTVMPSPEDALAAGQRMVS